jgi:hypothetical protein
MKMPFYVLTASVAPGNRVRGFHGTEPGSGASLIADIPRFRSGSFDVAIPGWPDPGPDDSLELKWDERKILRLYQDGTLVFRARADFDFLGWGVEPHAFPKFPKLDPLVVVEVNTSFVHRYRAVVESLKSFPDRVFFHLSLHNSAQNGVRLFLTEYLRGMVDWSTATRYPIQMDPAEEELTVAAKTLIDAPNAAAYEVVRTFATMFDMPEEKIPFIDRTGDQPEIDLEAIKALH